jgi:hypothetical protein
MKKIMIAEINMAQLIKNIGKKNPVCSAIIPIHSGAVIDAMPPPIR